MVKRSFPCFHPSRPEIDRGRMGGVPTLTLFRNGCDIHPISSEYQAAYFQNASGFKRPRCGAICGKPQFGETARVGNCLILTKNMD